MERYQRTAGFGGVDGGESGVRLLQRFLSEI
jgi:hypothetical protein